MRDNEKNVQTNDYVGTNHLSLRQKKCGTSANNQKQTLLPLRKLSGNDRLVAPALAYYKEFNEIPSHLVEVMASALHFYTPEDQESVELKNLIDENGVQSAFSKVSGLSEDHALVKEVVLAYNNINA